LLNTTLEATLELSTGLPIMDTVERVSEFDSGDAIEWARAVASVDREGLRSLLKGALG
jgi:hypothetical protein